MIKYKFLAMKLAATYKILDTKNSLFLMQHIITRTIAPKDINIMATIFFKAEFSKKGIKEFPKPGESFISKKKPIPINPPDTVMISR